MTNHLRERARRLPWTAFLGLAALSFVPAQNLQLETKDHQALGKTLAKYFDDSKSAKDDAKDKAKAEIAAALEKIGKKQGAKEAGEAVQSALRMTSDLGRAMFYSTKFETSLKAGKIATEEAPIDAKNKLPYGLLLPPTYKPTGAPLPLILCIPGSKDGKPVTPTEFLTEQLQEPALRDGAIVAAVTMPAALDTWNNEAFGIVLRTYGDLMRKATVDVDRIYLLGRGEGVAAAMQVAMRSPHRFAGVIGMAGDAGEVGHENFHNLPTYFQGAGAKATEFEGKIKTAGYNNCTIKADATVADVWSWIQQTPRASNPAKITLAPGTPIPNKAYWIEIPPTDGMQGVITAEADRATNTIRITAHGVRQVTVYFNNEIVDLSKPVKIVLNDREQQEKVVATLEEFLSLYARGTSDAGRIYVARRVYDVPS